MKQQWQKQLEQYNIWHFNNVNDNYTWLAGELNLSGKINIQNQFISINTKLDRIDINHNAKSIKIIDYKWKSNIAKDDIDNIQLLIYNYLYRQNIETKYKDYSISAVFLFLKQPDKQKGIKEIQPFSIEELPQKSHEFIQSFTNKMQDYHNQEPFIATPNKKCGFCDYRYMCVYKNIKEIEEE